MKRSSIKRYKVFAPLVFVLGLVTTVLTPMQSAFADPTPTITSITPSSGPTTGGTAVTIVGSGFNTSAPASTVTIGGTAATSVLVLDQYTITAVTPAGAAGAALVVVTNHHPSVKSSTSLVYFNYVPTYAYSITYAGGGGTGSMGPQSGTGSSVTLLLNTFVNSGYTFAGWLGSNTVSYTDGQVVALSAPLTVTLTAQWTVIPSHTVTFNANGGSGSMSPQTTNVPTALTLNAFTRVGYTFDHWNTAADNSGTSYADGATYSFAADVTLYAIWTVIPSHTVTFNANGGTGSMSPQTTNVPTALTLNAFTRLGYGFDHWNTAADGTGTSYADGATYSFAADVTLYAIWTATPSHTVTFNANGGTGSMSPQTTNVPTALTANAYTRVGYTFDHWNTAADNSGTSYADGATYSFAADMSLYAIWTVVPSHTVTFNANGGSGSMSPQTTNVPTALTANAYTRVGYTFDHWNTDIEGVGTSYADGATYSFAADVTLYAFWTALPSHTVTFNANGGTGSMSPQTTNVPTALTLNAFTRATYTFSHWNTAADGTGTTYLDGGIYSFAADATLYAIWTVIPSHTVVFMGNGSTGGTTASQTTNVPTALTLNGFIRTAYTFDHWNTAADNSGTTYADGATYSFAADLTLYAIWTAVPSHTVTFNANGGSGSMSPQTTNVPTALTLNAFTRSGYTFDHWNTMAEGTGTSYADGATYGFAADLTLYAQWTVIVSHTVTFNANGGSGSMSTQTNNTATALTANAFTRSGYTFDHWNTSADGTGTSYANGAVYSFAADVTLYAQWSVVIIVVPTTHTVTFNANGGSGSMSAQTASVPTALTVNAFALSGYYFAAWNTLANGLGTSYSNGAVYSFAADVILYAQWGRIATPPTTPAPPAAPPTPLTQTPLVLQAIPTQIPLGAFAALSWTGGSGQGAVTYATSTSGVCLIDEYGLVKGSIAGTCTVTATKAGDGIYASTTSNSVDITFVNLGAATPAPPEASPGLPSTGLPSTVVSTVKRTVKVSASALSKIIKVNLGAKFAGKKVTIQVRKAGTVSYKTLCVVALNKAGMAQIARQVSKGSALRILFGGRSLAATIVA